MTGAWIHRPEGGADTPPTAEPDAPTRDAGAGPDGSAITDELAVLDELEADLAAVEQAVASLERISGEGIVGEAAAAQIAAAVSVDRFGTAPQPEPA